MNNADPSFRPERLRVPITVRKVSDRVHRITSEELGPDSRAWLYYRQVLARAPGSRATIELVVALVVQETHARRVYSVRFGPPVTPNLARRP